MSAPTLIFETVHGSRAYGLDTPDSDVDLRGVLVGPREWYLGFLGGPEQLEPSKDHVRWELRKVMRLAAAANPTVLEVLWVDEDMHRVLTPAGRRLLDHRDGFLSRRVAGSFGGYAMSQLQRIRTHRRWLLHPPEKPPERADFGLPERATLPKDQLGAAEAMLADGRLTEADVTPNFLDRLDRERRYRAARREWCQYRQWLKHRNPARADLERRFGYDTKHAQHLVRLLRMGVEILETARVIVRRPDHEELRAIRAGAWTYDELMDAADTLHRRLKEAERRSPLPKAPDEEALNRLCVDLVREVLG